LSSILTALKKVENKSAALNRVFSNGQEITAKDTINVRVKRNMIRYQVFSIVFTVLLVFLGIWSVGKNKIYFKSKAAAPVSVNVTDVRTTEFAGIGTITSQNDYDNPEMSVSGNNYIRKFKNNDLPGPVLAHNNELLSTNTGILSDLSDGENKALTGIKPLTIITHNGKQLKLQAISWASDPENRIAVINGKIVREGGRVEGVTVIGIDKDYVSLHTGETEELLGFSLN